MTTWEPGMKVLHCREGIGRMESWTPDTVTRVTAASVITARNGAFRLKSVTSDGGLRRSRGDVWTGDDLLYPRDHPRAQAALKETRARRERRQRDEALRSDVVQTWVTHGTDDALRAAIAYLTETQARLAMAVGDES